MESRWTDCTEAVHLRDGLMMNLVTPTIRNGGVNCVYVVRHLIDQLPEDVSRQSETSLPRQNAQLRRTS